MSPFVPPARLKWILASTCFLILASFLFSPERIHAQIFELDRTDVGLGPAEVYVDSAALRIHVFTTGNDADKDGIYTAGSGEIPAMWYVLDTAGMKIDSLQFSSYFNALPLRVGVNQVTGRFYVPLGGKIVEYNWRTMKKVADLLNVKATTVACDPLNNTLIYTERPESEGGEWKATVYDVESHEIFSRYTTATDPAITVADFFYPDRQMLRYATLNRGEATGPGSSLTVVGFAPDIFRTVNKKPIGGAGTEFLNLYGKIILLQPASGTLRAFDEKTMTEEKSSPFVIDGGTGARSFSISGGGKLAVAAETDTVHLYDFVTQSAGPSIPLPGRSWGVALTDEKVYIAITKQGMTQKSDSLLLVADVATGVVTDTLRVPSGPIDVHILPNVGRLIVVGTREDGKIWWQAFDQQTLDSVGAGVSTIPALGPLATAIDPELSQLAIANGNILTIVDFSGGVAVESESTPAPEFSTDNIASGDGIWLITTTPGDFVPSPSYIIAIDKQTHQEIARVSTDQASRMIVAPAQTTLPGGFAAVAMMEGSFEASANIPLLYVEYQKDVLEGELGLLGNHLLHYDYEVWWNEGIAATMTGSHEITFLTGMDSTPEIVTRVATETTGEDGPRESILAPCAPIIYDGALIVSTRSGRMLFMAWEQVVRVLELESDGEGMGAIDDRVVIALPEDYQTESEERTVGRDVALVRISYPGGVEDIRTIRLQSIAPNPSHDRSLLSFTLEEASDLQIDLVDMQGAIRQHLHSGRLTSGEHAIPVATGKLEPGTYLLTILDNGTKKVRMTAKVEVVR